MEIKNKIGRPKSAYTLNDCRRDAVEMWTWLVEHPNEENKDNFLIKHPNAPTCACYKYAKNKCTFCPVKTWKISNNHCRVTNSPYAKWKFSSNTTERQHWAKEVLKLMKRIGH